MSDHQHSWRRVAIPDRPHSDAEAVVARAYDKGPRWIVGFRCTDGNCNAFRASDLTHERPVKAKVADGSAS